MKNLLLASALFVGFTTNANAGFLDFFLGGDKDEPKVVQKAPAAPTVTTDSKEALVGTALSLIPSLTKQLNISEQQAQGGVGSLMNFVKGSLSGDEFNQLKSGIPEMDSLLAKAPEIASSKAGKGISNVLGKMGKEGAKAAGLDLLNKQFAALGLNTEMIGQFAKFIMNYFSEQEGDTAALLQKGLSSLLG